MSLIERWVTVCPRHGVSYTAKIEPPMDGCYFWSDDGHCRESVEVVRLSNDQGAVVLDDSAIARAAARLAELNRQAVAGFRAEEIPSVVAAVFDAARGVES